MKVHLLEWWPQFFYLSVPSNLFRFIFLKSNSCFPNWKPSVTLITNGIKLSHKVVHDSPKVSTFTPFSVPLTLFSISTLNSLHAQCSIHLRFSSALFLISNPTLFLKIQVNSFLFVKPSSISPYPHLFRNPIFLISASLGKWCSPLGHYNLYLLYLTNESQFLWMCYLWQICLHQPSRCYHMSCTQ